jgi:hypothetical protein
MTIDRALAFAIMISAISAAGTGSALAQACTRQGTDVGCDDGRRGMLSGDAIIWADGTRSSLASPHPSVIIGNKSSVIVGQGVFARARVSCPWIIPARRTRHAAPSLMACRIATEDFSDRA